MFRRLAVFPLAAAILLPAATPAFAKPRIIAQATSPKNRPGVYLSRGLLPGKRYRIDMVVPNRTVKYSGYATEQFTYILNKRLGTYRATVRLKGTGSRSFTLSMPKALRRARVAAWMLVAEATSTTKSTRLTLRLVQT